MNLTYTLARGHRKERNPARKARSSSADSDVVEFSVSGAITGIFPRRRCGNVDFPSEASLFSCSRGSASSTGALNRRWANKLPLLNSCDSERKCSQRPWTRTQIELQKYKEALRNG
uniref:Uncharacterized protein n=1 Tax=Ascaris lumbricoides TaxID=6252 RepID=A0A0M3HUW5_ASCLU